MGIIYKVNYENFKGGVAAFYVNNKFYFLNLLRVYLRNRSLQLPSSSWCLIGQCYIAFLFLDSFSWFEMHVFFCKNSCNVGKLSAEPFWTVSSQRLCTAGYSGAMPPPDKVSGGEFREDLSTDV